MKNLLFYWAFLFISQEDVFAQKKSNKIETWEITQGYTEWKCCVINGYADNRCIDRMKFTFENY